MIQQFLHFFTFEREFDKIPTQNIKFKCKEAGCKLEAPIGDFSNINMHFHNKPDNHLTLKDCLFSNSVSKIPKKLLSDQELDLMKYFISSDSAITQFENSF